MKPRPTLVLGVAFLFQAMVSACAPSASPLAAPVTPAATDNTPAEPSIAITPDMGNPHVGDIAPDFELSDQEGKPLKLSSLRGSVVMLAFVTSWCPFSEAEQPNLKKLADDYAGKNVRVIAVDIKENDVGYAKYMERVRMPFPVL